VDKEEERIAINNMPRDEYLREYVRGYDRLNPKV